MKAPAYVIAILALSFAAPAIANACSDARQWSRYGYQDYWDEFRNRNVDPFRPLSQWTRPRSVPQECERYYSNGVGNARSYAQSFYGPYN